MGSGSKSSEDRLCSRWSFHVRTNFYLLFLWLWLLNQSDFRQHNGVNCKSSMRRKLNSNLESLERLACKEFEWIFFSIWRFWCVGYTSVVLKNDHGGRMKMTLLVFALLFGGSLAGCSGKHVCKDRITNNTAVYFFGMCSGAWFSSGMRLGSTSLVTTSPSSNQRSSCLFL